MILNGFLKKSFFKIGMWHSRPPRDPPPLHGKCHLKFPFWLLAHLPNRKHSALTLTLTMRSGKKYNENAKVMVLKRKCEQKFCQLYPEDNLLLIADTILCNVCCIEWLIGVNASKTCSWLIQCLEKHPHKKIGSHRQVSFILYVIFWIEMLCGWRGLEHKKMVLNLFFLNLSR